ncbi:MAG: pantoate--beta-alanine ligase [Alphaproteobacteria bacterium]|nr:pantoate--beta-alanine ligase [Alphaproteobacteria bacterium]
MEHDRTLITLPFVRGVPAVRREVARLRSGGRTIALIQTGGGLHEGHVALGELARRRGAAVVYAIYPERGPAEEAADALLLQTEDVCDALYAPAARDMFPEGFATALTVGGAAAGELEDDGRAEAMRTAALVTAKLMMQVLPDVMVFGEKAYQNLLAARRVAADLNIPVEIVAAPILRESDGLAVASANADLDAGQRQVAGRLNLVLRDVIARLHGGDRPAHAAAFGFGELLAAGFDKIDYLEVRDSETLAAPAPGRPLRVLAAARIGGLRLTDNMEA